MSKKYLSLDEASAHLSIPKDELMRMREKGDIRGFADRGTWKFKIEDIEELARTRQVDSDPEVPMLRDEPEESDILLGDASSNPDIESDILLSEPSEDVGEQPTVIRKKGADLEGSDSDVRLVSDDSSSPVGSDPDTSLQPLSDSDSDVDSSQMIRATATFGWSVRAAKPTSNSCAPTKGEATATSSSSTRPRTPRTIPSRVTSPCCSRTRATRSSTSTSPPTTA